ncbi:MAG: hypothetical protein FD189_404 [Elusimicrobia bacterium]|nr:MAG: hypothetical protein FD154_484 [Elusimicrobiota bacterium]KAF0157883.1 MAG: hypothetical protein FD189_404 [Elusimicrobiota bacterium]
MGKIYSINVSKAKGVPKSRADKAMLLRDLGIEGDAHAAPGRGADASAGIRQVSLLDIESIRGQMADAKAKGATVEIRPGVYAENITTEGLDLAALRIGDRLKAGPKAILRISRIGKECHSHCAIYRQVGDCIMPRKGIFAEVLEGGEIAAGDTLEKI